MPNKRKKSKVPITIWVENDLKIALQQALKENNMTLTELLLSAILNALKKIERSVNDEK